MTRPTAHGDAALARLELHALDGRSGTGADLRARGDELLHVEAVDDDQAHGPR